MYLLLALLHLVFIAVATGHALLHKRDPRAALGWVGICLIFPIVGPFIYFVFGINRVRTRAQKLEKEFPFRIHLGPDRPEFLDLSARSIVPAPEGLAPIARISDTVSRWPRTAGNRVEMLLNGEQAYPAMLRAIEEARRTVFMTSYIFSTDATGKRFIDALGGPGPPERCGRAGPGGRHRRPVHLSPGRAPAAAGRRPGRIFSAAQAIPADLPPEPAKPPEASRHRRPARVRGRHEHPRPAHGGGHRRPGSGHRYPFRPRRTGRGADSAGLSGGLGLYDRGPGARAAAGSANPPAGPCAGP